MKSMVSRIFFIVVFIAGFVTAEGQPLRIPSAPPLVRPEKAVYALIGRIFPGRENDFVLQLIPPENGKDIFELYSMRHKIFIKGNNAVSLSYGLNYYLRTYCHASVSWCGDLLRLPQTLPVVPAKQTIRAALPDRLYFNYCTFSYSMAFWDWARWEREIDWMALHGINLPLALVGQEAVWQNTLRRIGLSDTAIRSFIPGPAFNAWWLMGNLEGWGGPVSQQWIDGQRTLQQKILLRMRELDMHPVLQGFYGMVPNVLKQQFPSAAIHDPGSWLGFRRPAFLMPADSLFSRIAAIYYEEQAKLYGETRYFQGDPFHEGGRSDGVDITAAARSIYANMEKATPNAIWILQAWQNNPKPDLLKGIPPGRAIITDLFAEARPQWGGTPSLWQRKEGFLGHQWLFSEIPNFGGRTGMTAKLDRTNRDIINAFHHPDGKGLAGVAATPEAIGQDPVLYDLLFDMAWRTDTVDMKTWLRRYIDSRYGMCDDKAMQAWQILRNTVYRSAYEEGDPPLETILCARPGWNKTKTSSWGYDSVDYDPRRLIDAWTLLIAAGEGHTPSDGYKYDLVNITRQVLDNYGRTLYRAMHHAFFNKDTAAFHAASAAFLQLIRDQDKLLGTRKEFLLGGWLKLAKDRAGNDAERSLYEWNARTLITVWTFELNDVNDYSYREWNGLLKDYYLPRWQQYIQYCRDQLSGADKPLPDFFNFEKTWTYETKTYADKPAGGEVTTVKDLYRNYYRRCRNSEY